MKPIEAQNNIDLPIVLEEQICENESEIWFITYGKELQGLVITDREIEFPYYDIYTALLNIFLNDSPAILILEGYMMALLKQMNDFSLTRMPATLLACLILMALRCSEVC